MCAMTRFSSRLGELPGEQGRVCALAIRAGPAILRLLAESVARWRMQERGRAGPGSHEHDVEKG